MIVLARTLLLAVALYLGVVHGFDRVGGRVAGIL